MGSRVRQPYRANASLGRGPRCLVAGMACGALMVVAGCNSAPSTPPPPGATAAPPAVLTPAPNVPGDAMAGQQLFNSKGCGGCHTLAGLPGATGVAGPNLTNVVIRPTLAGNSIPMTPANLTQWLMDPQSLKHDASMPAVGLTQQQAQDLAAYLYSLPYNPGSGA